MRRPFLRLCAALSLAAFSAAACSDAPTGSRQTEAREDAQIGFSANLAGLSVDLLVVQVTAADIATPLAFNVPVSNGTATGSLTVPAGTARTITVRAFDAQGTQTHEGAATVDVRPGQNVNVPLTLVPRPGHVPISINFGSVVVAVARVKPAPAGGDVVGDTIRLAGTVTYPGGAPVSGARVSWATLNPAVATVDSLGLVTAKGAGTTQIVGTYGGFGAGATLTFVLADGTNGTQDRTMPRLTGFTVTPDSLNMNVPFVPGVDPMRTVMFDVTATDAMGLYAMSLSLRSPDGQVSKQCYFNSTPQPGTSTMGCGIALSKYAQAGKWTVEDLSIADSRGNGRTFTSGELAAAGFDNGVFLFNTGVDSQAPRLDSIYFAPDTIQLGTGYSQATLRIFVSDDLAGVQRVTYGARGLDGLTHGFGGDALRVAPGVYESYVQLSSTFPPAGRSAVVIVEMEDHAGNRRYLQEAELEAQGKRAVLTILP